MPELFPVVRIAKQPLLHMAKQVTCHLCLAMCAPAHGQAGHVPPTFGYVCTPRGSGMGLSRT